MRKLLYLLLVLPVALFLGACDGEAGEEVDDEEVDVDVDVDEEPLYEMVELDPTPVIYKELTGDYSLFGDALEEGFAVLEAAGIELVGAPFGYYYDDPFEIPVEEWRYELLLPVAADTEPPEGYAYKVTEALDAVMLTFEGEMTEENTPDYYALFEYVAEQGLKPFGYVVEIYYWGAEDPAEYVTELCVPYGEPAEAEEEAVEETVEEPVEETAEEPAT